MPPNKNIKDNIELRINNCLLTKPSLDQGWLVYSAQQKQLATGENLVGLRMCKPVEDDRSEVLIEKYESRPYLAVHN